MERNFHEKDWKNLIDNEDFKEAILKEVQDACKKGGTENIETPRNIKIVADTWTPESGLVTDALKLKRRAIEQKYKDDINELYNDKPKTDSAEKNKKQ